MKGIAATTKIDLHNTRLTKESLDEAAHAINSATHAPSFGVDHDWSIMPIGKVVMASVEKLDEEDYALYVEQDLFESYTAVMNGQKYIMLKSLVDDRPFSIDQEEVTGKLLVQTDPVNFESYETMREFFSNISDEYDVETGQVMRKSAVPDPVLLINLAQTTISALFLYLASKEAIAKVGDHILDGALKELDKLYEFIKKLIFSGAKYLLPKNRPVTYVFKGQADFLIELIVQTISPHVAIESIGKEKIQVILTELEHLRSQFADITKVQLTYNCEVHEWEFNFLTTDKGEVIGTEESYKKSVRKIDLAFPKHTLQDD